MISPSEMVDDILGQRDIIVPLVEETLHLTKRLVEKGRVRVSLTTEVVQEQVKETLQTRRAVITHVPVNREVTEIPPNRQEGDVLIIPVVEEVVVVVKRLVLREEIRLRLIDQDEPVELPATRRIQHASVERVEAPVAAADSITPLTPR